MSELERELELAKPNPITQASYRRQVRLEVYLPLALFSLTFAALVIYFLRGQVATVSGWADAGLILLLLPALVIGLLLSIVLGGLAYGIGLLLVRIPPFAFQVQRVFYRIAIGAERAMRLTARPFVLVQSNAAKLKRGGQIVKSIFEPPAADESTEQI